MTFSEETDPTSIPGYYEQKTKKKIGNLNDLINNMRKLSCLTKFTLQSDLDFAGIRKFFCNFMERVKHKLASHPVLKHDLRAQIDEIADYIMKGLWQNFFPPDPNI